MELPNKDNSYGFIYCTTNLLNGKKYIGRHAGKVKDTYLGSGALISKAIKKYGKNNFERDILQYCVDFEDLKEGERYWGEYFNVDRNEVFYNLAPCGLDIGGWNKGIPMTQEAKDHLSKKLKGKNKGKKMNLSDEQLAKISAAHKGKIVSKETRDKMSSAKKGRRLTEEQKRNISKKNTGKVMSEGARLKISIAHTGKKLSESTKKLLSDINKGKPNPINAQKGLGRKQSPETIEKRVSKIKGRKNINYPKNRAKQIYTNPVQRSLNLSNSLRGKNSGKDNGRSIPIVQLDLDSKFIRYWDCISDAVRYLKSEFGGGGGDICSALSGKTKTAYKFKWMYWEDYDKLKEIK